MHSIAHFLASITERCIGYQVPLQHMVPVGLSEPLFPEHAQGYNSWPYPGS